MKAVPALKMNVDALQTRAGLTARNTPRSGQEETRTAKSEHVCSLR